MKKPSIFAFLALSLAFLVPAPGRFIYGIVLVLEMNILVMLNCFFVVAIKHLGLEKIKTVLIFIFVLSITIFYRQILILIQPEIVLTLGFVMYLCPVSSFLIANLFISEKNSLLENVKQSSLKLLFYSIYSLLFFLFRDIFGFGTITFFGSNHRIFEKVLFDFEKVRIFSIFASIPGALILASVILFVYFVIYNKLKIVDNAEALK